MWFDWAKREVTIIYRQNKIEIQPTKITIPIGFLDTVFAARLSQELAQQGVSVQSLPVPGGTPPSPRSA